MNKLCRNSSINFYIRRNRSIKGDFSIYCCIKTLDSSPKELCLVSSIKRISTRKPQNYSATKAYAKGFCQQKYKLGDVRLKFLTYAFIDELKTYILSNPLKQNDPCTNNGCMKHLERIKKIKTWAYEMRFIDRNAFASFKIKKNPYESQNLHWEQLKILEGKTFQRPLLNLVKDLFVFCCYTGMAPVDVQHLQPMRGSILLIITEMSLHVF